MKTPLTWHWPSFMRPSYLRTKADKRDRQKVRSWDAATQRGSWADLEPSGNSTQQAFRPDVKLTRVCAALSAHLRVAVPTTSLGVHRATVWPPGRERW
eukprot:scaffold2643_cov387-Prasinococcus_capsulatus_cf.AAC.8